MAKIDFPYINLSVSFMPTSALPIDARTFFTDMDEMTEAAESAEEVGSSDSPYYFGQLLTYKSPDSTETELYKVVKKNGKGALMPIASLTRQQVAEIVDEVVEDPRIVKIGNDVTTMTNPAVDSGIVYSTNNGLHVNLSPISGLMLTETGLEIETSDEGNISLTKTENGLKGEFCWMGFDENER